MESLKTELEALQVCAIYTMLPWKHQVYIQHIHLYQVCAIHNRDTLPPRGMFYMK